MYKYSIIKVLTLNENIEGITVSEGVFSIRSTSILFNPNVGNIFIEDSDKSLEYNNKC